MATDPLAILCYLFLAFFVYALAGGIRDSWRDR